MKEKALLNLGGKTFNLCLVACIVGLVGSFADSYASHCMGNPLTLATGVTFFRVSALLGLASNVLLFSVWSGVLKELSDTGKLVDYVKPLTFAAVGYTVLVYIAMTLCGIDWVVNNGVWMVIVTMVLCVAQCVVILRAYSGLLSLFAVANIACLALELVISLIDPDGVVGFMAAIITACVTAIPAAVLAGAVIEGGRKGENGDLADKLVDSLEKLQSNS